VLKITVFEKKEIFLPRKDAANNAEYHKGLTSGLVILVGRLILLRLRNVASWFEWGLTVKTCRVFMMNLLKTPSWKTRKKSGRQVEMDPIQISCEDGGWLELVRR
jgi:hypothetical protein